MGDWAGVINGRRIVTLLGICLGSVALYGQPNVVVILVDDFGVDAVGAYGEAPNPPCTPQIDALAAEGVLFRNAWVNPSCSPTRAQLLTGLHARNNGIGGIVRIQGRRGLAVPEVTLPRALQQVGYETALIGKWHLATTPDDVFHPNQAGFDYFSGSMENLANGAVGPDPYRNWQKNTQGAVAVETGYATRVTSLEAMEQAGRMQPPWFLQVNYNAPHGPYHWPPADLCPQSTCSNSQCGFEVGGRASRIRATIEVLDDQIGQLLSHVRAVDPNVVVFLLGDNGTDKNFAQLPFDPNRAKNTLYEGGLNVPLIVAGPNVARGEESDALVSGVDLLATVVSLAGGRVATPDSVSFARQLYDPAAAGRRTVFAESFNINFDPRDGFPLQPLYERAVRNERYKLIRTIEQEQTRLELFDLLHDPFERNNLYPAQTIEVQAAYQALTEAFVMYQAVPAADFDGNGIVGLEDLAVLLRNYRAPDVSHAQGDATLDGSIDVSDLAVLLATFGLRG